MFKIILIYFALILSSLTAEGGQLKELLIEAEDAITYKMLSIDSIVDSISNPELTSIQTGLVLVAEVSTHNTYNDDSKNWICTVNFEKENLKFVIKSVECN